MSKARLSTGSDAWSAAYQQKPRIYPSEFDGAVRAIVERRMAKAAEREARAILAETEPATAMVLAVRRPSTLTQHAAFGALAEALAAFVVA